jgi:Ni,Fe-hydrogenase maturation factor
MQIKKVFVFGTENDPIAWKVADRLKDSVQKYGYDFIRTSNPDDIIDHDKDDPLIIMDAVRGIDRPCTLAISDLKDNSKITTHDIDLGMTLQLLEKTGKMRNVKIIGIPLDAKIDEQLIIQVMRILRPESE